MNVIRRQFSYRTHRVTENMTASGLRAVDISPDNELLRGLEQQEIDLILTAARSRRFSAKSVITNQGEPADRFMLLLKGRARYFYESVDG